MLTNSPTIQALAVSFQDALFTDFSLKLLSCVLSPPSSSSCSFLPHRLAVSNYPVNSDMAVSFPRSQPISSSGILRQPYMKTNWSQEKALGGCYSRWCKPSGTQLMLRTHTPFLPNDGEAFCGTSGRGCSEPWFCHLFGSGSKVPEEGCAHTLCWGDPEVMPLVVTLVFDPPSLPSLYLWDCSGLTLDYKGNGCPSIRNLGRKREGSQSTQLLSRVATWQPDLAAFLGQRTTKVDVFFSLLWSAPTTSDCSWW